MSEVDLSVLGSRREGEKAFPPSVQEILDREFEKDEIEQRKGFGSQVFHYPRAEAVISRLNEAFGSCWSFVVREHFKDPLAEETIVVLGELVINHPEHPIRIIQQFAGKQVNKNRNGGINNIANDYKSAASLAFRKCALQIGIGIYLQKGLPDEDLDTSSGSEESTSSSSGSNAAPPQARSDKPASEKQVNFAKTLYKSKGITENIDFDNLSSADASNLIGKWKDLPNADGSSPKDTTDKSKSEPKKVEEKTSTSAPVEKEDSTPKEESEDMKRLRRYAAELIGMDDDINSERVDKFILHIYKTHFSTELDSVNKIKPEEISELLTALEE